MIDKNVNISINIDDYLSFSEIKDICIEAIRDAVYENYRQKESDIDRLISNLGYEFIFEAVSKAIGKDAEEMIARKVSELAQKDDVVKYEMWRRNDMFGREDSPAIKIMNEAIEDNKFYIRALVSKVIDNFEFTDVKDAIYDMACEVISEKLFGKNE